MRVVHIHAGAGDAGGGGGVSMYRLHRALMERGVDSKILAYRNRPVGPDIGRLPRLPRIERAIAAVTSRLGLNDVHRIGSFLLPRHADFRLADVIHFHCMHTNAFSYLALPRVAALKPCVLSLHDMWPMTGHCGFSRDCTRWKSGCGHCPYPTAYPAIRRDASWLEWRLKSRAFKQSRITLVSKCEWMEGLIPDSLLRDQPSTVIPQGVDTEVFRPQDKASAKDCLGLEADKQVLLFAALDLPDRRKGADLLMQSLAGLPKRLKQGIELVTFGRGAPQLADPGGLKIRDLGYISDDHMKALAYSAADIFLCPTRADNAPLVVRESMACGTPVVAFRVGGVPEIVRPGLTGELADPEDVQGFRDGILRLLHDREKRLIMNGRCRQVAVSEYSLNQEASEHVRLYESLLAPRVLTRPKDPPEPAPRRAPRRRSLHSVAKRSHERLE